MHRCNVQPLVASVRKGHTCDCTLRVHKALCHDCLLLFAKLTEAAGLIAKVCLVLCLGCSPAGPNAASACAQLAGYEGCTSGAQAAAAYLYAAG